MGCQLIADIINGNIVRPHQKWLCSTMFVVKIAILLHLIEMPHKNNNRFQLKWRGALFSTCHFNVHISIIEKIDAFLLNLSNSTNCLKLHMYECGQTIMLYAHIESWHTHPHSLNRHAEQCENDGHHVLHRYQKLLNFKLYATEWIYLTFVLEFCVCVAHQRVHSTFILQCHHRAQYYRFK